MGANVKNVFMPKASVLLDHSLAYTVGPNKKDNKLRVAAAYIPGAEAVENSPVFPRNCIGAL